jgi:hypothetical protein
MSSKLTAKIICNFHYLLNIIHHQSTRMFYSISKDRIRSFIIIVFLASSITSCRSNDDYSKIAVAGSTYIDAINLLLEESANTRIDLTSEQILAIDRVGSGINTKQYNDLSDADKNITAALNRIIEHNSIVKDYFSLLQELATSDSPQRAQVEIENVAKNLTTIGDLIRKDKNISISSTSSSARLGAISNFIVKLQIKEALKKELEQRGQLIDRELETQQEALKTISKLLLDQKRLILDLQETRFVTRPITASTPVNNEDKWIETRRNILKMNVMSSKLNNASSALGKFRSIFKSVIEGKSDLTSINLFLAEVEAFTKLINNK